MKQSINLKNKLLGYIGKRIQVLRKEQGFSQEEFGRFCLLDRSYMGRVERGEQNMSIETLAKICLALKCDPSVLFPNYFALKNYINQQRALDK